MGYIYSHVPSTVKLGYTQALRGADVVILPDNDEDGHPHATHVAQQLQGQTRRVRIVALPGLPPKGEIRNGRNARRATR